MSISCCSSAGLPAFAVVQGAAEANAPPIDAFAAQLTLLAFLCVMIAVPWLLARDRAGGDDVVAQPSKGADPTSFFTSERERRLWMWVAAVLVLIYATLSPMQRWAALLRERGLLTTTTTIVLLGIAAVLAIRWARTKPGRREIGAVVGIVAVYVTTLIRLPVPEARSHLFEYGLVAMLLHQIFLERREHGRRPPLPAVSAVLVAAALGWLDEGIQFFLPNRVYDLVDVGFNAVAASMAVLASVFMSWTRSLDLGARLRGRDEPSANE